LPLGKPKSVRSGDPKSIVTRDFDGGLVAYNHFGNGVKTLELPAPVKRHSTGETGTRFEIQDADGDVFLPLE
jgi:hypothetical protein